MSAEQLKGHLDPLVLAILEQGPAHGYAIIESLRSRSDGVFDLPEGTIYPALHRLERSGAVTSRREVVGGRERRVYQLSARGSTALRQRRADWRLFATAVSDVLGLSPS
jgi:DNA-binding PadR family transcriptional regulator